MTEQNILTEDDAPTLLPGAATVLEDDTIHAKLAPTPLTSSKPSLIGLDLDEMTAAIAGLGFKPFRAKQIWNWIYARGASDFEQMTNISKQARADLAEHFTVSRPSIAKHLVSTDGTQKWLVEYADQNKIESVFIPQAERGSLCISSQVGCTLACTFCHTGTMKLVRNLTAGEIVEQALICRDALGDWPDAGHNQESRPADRDSHEPAKQRPTSERVSETGGIQTKRLTNIIMMGMGEPLYNEDQVIKALKIMMSRDGLDLSKRRITLSTSGVVPAMKRMGEEVNVNLAISLHAVNDELRDELVPLNKKYPIKELMQACKDYPGATYNRRITFEYVMLKGVNDSDADARELVKMLKGLYAKVNLIPFNPWQGSSYECSDMKRIQAFADILHKGGYVTPIRRARGQDIYAACGMLKSDSERKKGQKVWLGKTPPAK